MNNSPIPAGEPRLVPYLVVDDPAGLIVFLTAVFDAQEVRRIHRPDGSIMHAEIRIGEGGVMIGGANENHPAITSMIHLYVEDADEAHAAALANGAEDIWAPSEAGDGDRRGGFRDASGNQWWVSSRIETLTDAEIEDRMQAGPDK